jgi:hypothetical protein
MHKNTNKKKKKNTYVDRQTRHEQYFDYTYDKVSNLLIEIKNICSEYNTNLFIYTTSSDFFLFLTNHSAEM